MRTCRRDRRFVAQRKSGGIRPSLFVECRGTSGRTLGRIRGLLTLRYILCGIVVNAPRVLPLPFEWQDDIRSTHGEDNREHFRSCLNVSLFSFYGHAATMKFGLQCSSFIPLTNSVIIRSDIERPPRRLRAHFFAGRSLLHTAEPIFFRACNAN